MIPHDPPRQYPPPADAPDRLADDLAYIREYCDRAAVAAIADALRGGSGPLPVPYYDDPPVPSLRGYQRVTVRPVQLDEPEHSGFWQRHGFHVAVGGAVALIGTAAVLLVVSVLNALGRMATNISYAASSALPSLGGICLLVLLVLWLLGRGGGGNSFSGTFSGKMH